MLKNATFQNTMFGRIIASTTIPWISIQITSRCYLDIYGTWTHHVKIYCWLSLWEPVIHPIWWYQNYRRESCSHLQTLYNHCYIYNQWTNWDMQNNYNLLCTTFVFLTYCFSLIITSLLLSNPSMFACLCLFISPKLLIRTSCSSFTIIFLVDKVKNWYSSQDKVTGGRTVDNAWRL
mgnify:CR=1 FL=1